MADRFLQSYTGPTWRLELRGKTSPLAQWTGKPTVKGMRFQLHRLPEDAAAELLFKGDRVLLETFQQATEHYVQQQLYPQAAATSQAAPPWRTSASLPASLPAPDQPGPSLTSQSPASLASREGLPIATLLQTSPSASSALSSDSSPRPLPVFFQWQPEGLVRHRLSYQSSDQGIPEQSWSLSTLELFDLSEILDRWRSEMVALPTLDSTAARWQWGDPTPDWARLAASVTLAVGLSGGAIAFLGGQGLLPTLTAQRGSSPAGSPTGSGSAGQIAGLPHGGSGAGLSPFSTALPSVPSGPSAPALPNTEGPNAEGIVPPAPGAQTLGDAAAPNASSSDRPGSSTGTIAPSGAGASNDSGAILETAGGTTRAGTGEPPAGAIASQASPFGGPARSGSTTTIPMPVGAAGATGSGVTGAGSAAERALPYPDAAIASAPQPATRIEGTAAVAPPAPPAPAAVTNPSAALSQAAVANRTGAADLSAKASASPEQLRQTPREVKVANPLPPTPQVGEIQRYFQQRWQAVALAPAPSQSLQYRLSVDAEGKLEAFQPLTPLAGQYVDRAGLPLRGEMLTSAIDDGALPTVILTLRPNGQVEVVLERLTQTAAPAPANPSIPNPPPPP